MRFNISSASLANAIQTVTSIVSDKPAMPVLGGVLVTAGDGEVTFRTTDMTTSVIARMTADIEDGGEVVISARLMRGIAKSLPDDTVAFSTDGDTALLKCQKSRWVLHTIDAIDFPAWDNFVPESEITLSRRLLADMVERVYRVASKEDSQPILKSIHVSASDGKIELSATDGHRMVAARADCMDGEFIANVPSTALKGAMTSKSPADMVTVGCSGVHVRIDDGRFSYITRLAFGNFPKMDMLMPKGFSTVVRLDSAELTGALKRSDVVASINPSVRVTVNDSGLTIYAKSPDQGESTETVPVELDGDQITIGLNHNYVLDCVSHVDGEIEFCMNGPMQPAVIKNYDEVDTTYLLMPVKI